MTILYCLSFFISQNDSIFLVARDHVDDEAPVVRDARKDPGVGGTPGDRIDAVFVLIKGRDQPVLGTPSGGGEHKKVNMITMVDANGTR